MSIYHFLSWHVQYSKSRFSFSVLRVLRYMLSRGVSLHDTLQNLVSLFCFTNDGPLYIHLLILLSLHLQNKSYLSINTQELLMFLDFIMVALTKKWLMGLIVLKRNFFFYQFNKLELSSMFLFL